MPFVANGNPHTMTPPSADVWGFGTDSAGLVASGTLAKMLADNLVSDSAGDITAATASYVWDHVTGWPRTSYAITKAGDVGGDEITWTGATALDPEDYGYDSSLGDQSIAGSTTPTAAMTLNSAAYWAPHTFACKITPQPIVIAYGSFAPSDPSFNQRRSWGSRTARRVQIDWVDRAYMLQEWAADSATATTAGRNVLDSRNTFDALLTAMAAPGTEIRIYVNDGEYATGIVATSDPLGFADIAREMSIPSKYGTTLIFVDTAAYVRP